MASKAGEQSQEGWTETKGGEKGERREGGREGQGMSAGTRRHDGEKVGQRDELHTWSKILEVHHAHFNGSHPDVAENGEAQEQDDDRAFLQRREKVKQ